MICLKNERHTEASSRPLCQIISILSMASVLTIILTDTGDVQNIRSVKCFSNHVHTPLNPNVIDNAASLHLSRHRANDSRPDPQSTIPRTEAPRQMYRHRDITAQTPIMSTSLAGFATRITMKSMIVVRQRPHHSK